MRKLFSLIAAVLFTGSMMAAALSCAEAVEQANSGSTATVTVRGYVTEIAYAWKNGSTSFWMADTKDGGKVFEAYKCECEEADAPAEGDLVEATGTLSMFQTTAELAAGCTVVIIERAESGGGGGEEDADVVFVGSDFAGQGVSGTGGPIELTKEGITVAASAGYGQDGYAVRIYKNSSFSISSSDKKIEKIKFQFYGTYTGGLNAEVEVNALEWSVEAMSQQARLDKIEIFLEEGGSVTPGTKRICLVPGVWDLDGALYAAATLNYVPDNSSLSMSLLATATLSKWFVFDDDASAYVAEIPEDARAIAFGRFDPSGAPEDGPDASMLVTSLWNHTDILEIDPSMKYTIDGWPDASDAAQNCPGHWGDPVEPEVEYFLTGTFNGWVTGDPSYKLYPNPATEGEYMLLVDFEAGAEFKVIGTVVDIAGSTEWYPDGENNDYVISEAGQYMVYFRPDGQGGEGWHYGYIYVEPYQEPPVPLYDVADAIAAELAKDDVIQVRGIITKIEFKGKNFAKYGSVCFYVEDASGAEGEFEFFNCYSLDEKKFTVSDPEFDETSTQWAQFDAVTDEDGNVIEVGDLIIAQGKYEFYNNQKHELQQNCYLIDVQKGVGPEPQTIELDVVYCDALYFTDEDSGVRGLQFNLYKDWDSSTQTVTYPDFYIGVVPKSETALAGSYSENDIYFVEMDIAENTTVEAEEILSDFVVTWLGKDEEGNNWYQYTFKFLGDDGNTYIINLEETYTMAYDDDASAYVEIDEEGGSSVEPGYYLVGSFTEWEPLSSYMLSLNQAAETEEYMIEVRLFAEDEFKVVQVDEAGAWTWFPAEGGNYAVSEDLGIVTVYFRPNYDGGSDWFYNCIYVAQGGQPGEWDFVTAQYDQYDDGSVDVALLTSEGWSRTGSSWTVDVAGTALILNIFPQNSEDMSDLTGNYSSEDGTLDISYSGALTWDGQSSSFDVLLFTSGNVTVAFNQDQSGYILTYDLFDEDGNEYAGTAEIPLAVAVPIDMTFDFAYDEASVSVTVTPSDNVNKWDYWCISKERYETEFGSDPDALAQYSYELWGDNYASAGAKTIDFSGRDAGDYVLVVYGCNGGITTAPAIFEFTVLAPANHYYLVGTFNDWTPSSDYVLTANEAAETEEYMILTEVAEGDEFKVVYVSLNEETGEREWTWFPNQGGNYVIYHDYAGAVNVYCRPNYDGNEGWYYNCLYVQKYDPQVIDINIQSGVKFSDLTSAETPFWGFEAENEEYYVLLYSADGVSTIAGEYTFEEFDPEYSYIETADGDEILFTNGSFTVTVEEGDVIIFNGSFTGSDFNIYNIYLRYVEPKADETVDVQIINAEIGQDWLGNTYIYGTSADDIYVDVLVSVDEEGNPVDGEYTNNVNIYLGEDALDVYSASFKVETQEDGSIIVTAVILCYNNTLYNVRMTTADSFPQGIEEITADGQTIKVLRNGHVFILRGDKIFNLQGILVK